jgi:hypothetical protein
MSKKNRGFNIATSNFDYKKTTLVARELISAIEHYKRFEMFNAGEDIDNATSNLKEAGTLAYQAIEHAYKNVIHYYYKYKLDRKEITQSQFDSYTSFMSLRPRGKTANHFVLKNKFCELYPSHTVDIELIFRGSHDSNNGPKHDAKVPNPTDLKVQLGEMIKFFKKYISADEDYPALVDTTLGEEYAWLEFRNDFDDFSDSFQYVLVAPPFSFETKTLISNIFCLNWDLIIDFDPASDEKGLKNVYENSYKIAPVTRTLNYVDSHKSFIRSLSPHWIMANGFYDQEDTMVDNYRKWWKKYGQNLKDTIRKFRNTYAKPVKMVLLPGLGEDYLQSILTSCADAFTAEDSEGEINTTDIDIALLEGEAVCLNIDEDFIKRTTLTVSEFLLRLGTRISSVITETIAKTVPGLALETGMPQDLYSKLEEFCEVVYIGIEKDDSPNDVKEFYNGTRPISWYELAHHKDLERTIYTKEYYKKLSEIMESRPRTFYSCCYRPGFGGTTQLRRIAWDFHEKYPTIIINRYSDEDISYLKQLYDLSKSTLLILVDSNFINISTARSISTDLKSENISHNVLFMNRNDSLRNAEKNSLFILPELSENEEIPVLVELLQPYALNELCETRINSFITNPSKCEEKSPFYVALSTFDEEFKGIRQYVRNFIISLSADLRKFLVFIALAEYVNKPLDVQYFGNIIRNDDVVDFLSESGAFRTLVSFTKMPNRLTYCKIKYSAFGREILKQASVGFSDKEMISIQFLNLTDMIVEFIEMSRPNPLTRNNNVVDFLREMLITRKADSDAQKPIFAPMIQNIIDTNTYLGVLSQEGQNAISIIFHKLVEVYPEDSHFRAHLARYLCYIEKAYKPAINLLNEAIEIDADESIVQDPLLLHMKAMVYSAYITQKVIPEIKKQHQLDPEGSAVEDEMFAELKSNLKTAQELFGDVREMNSGIAGHISDIKLCLSIIDLGKALDGTDTATFLEKHHNDWYLNLVDRANNLFEDCKELKDELDEEDKERIDDVDRQLKTIREGISATIAMYTQYLDESPDYKRPYIRRYLARAYGERTLKSNSQEDWGYIAELMTDNMRDDPSNPCNIRVWFNAILHIKSNNTDETLRQAIIRLNEWVTISDNVEAHFYRYVLTFIQAIEGITDAESRLPGYLIKLKALSNNMLNRTSFHYWLGKTGSGIERLIPDNKFPRNDVAKAKNMLEYLRGRISPKYKNETHAYITAYKTDIFFSPDATDQKVNAKNINAPVTFGIGFSFDGPRAYNSSVELNLGDETVERVKLESLGYGVYVKCEVLKNNEVNYITVRILGYNVEGGIEIRSLAEPFSDLKRPCIGQVLDAMILNEKRVISRGGTYRSVWALTMKSEKQSDEIHSEPAFKQKLREYSETHFQDK